ncbi:hypothetical protein DCAR_0103065 [Daucus carota subsp. sativus]|uniref:Uncharacterized protein n=2 Tax=Daucus carota subsp. sativus TaxID=79200 RepID=A0A166HHL6_DAUCS|nr:hypothetical protein DCAR_0103065 [Daucus carota subsp. sativus]
MKNFVETPEKIRELNEEEEEEEVIDDDDDEKEEEKIETFFALVRGYQEARNRRRNELKELETRNTKKIKNDSGWVPAFRWEDFTHENERKCPLAFQIGRAGLVSGIDKKKEKVEDEYNEDELDLTLAL